MRLKQLTTTFFTDSLLPKNKLTISFKAIFLFVFVIVFLGYFSQKYILNKYFEEFASMENDRFVAAASEITTRAIGVYVLSGMSDINDEKNLFKDFIYPSGGSVYCFELLNKDLEAISNFCQDVPQELMSDSIKVVAPVPVSIKHGLNNFGFNGDSVFSYKLYFNPMKTTQYINRFKHKYYAVSFISALLFMVLLGFLYFFIRNSLVLIQESIVALGSPGDPSPPKAAGFISKEAYSLLKLMNKTSSIIQDYKLSIKADSDEKLKRLEKDKNFFEYVIGSVSHELREPVQISGVWLHSLKSDVTAAIDCYSQGGEAVSKIDNLIKLNSRQARAIQSVLELQPSGEVAVDEMGILSFIGGLRDTFMGQSFKKSPDVRVIYFLDDGLPELIKAPLNQISSLFWINVQNSTKFCSKGVVKISFKVLEVDGKNFLGVSFFDTGIGIPSSCLENDFVFQKFTQADFGDDKSYKGTGIGLSLVSSFIEQVDGIKSCRSVFHEEINEYSPFSFTEFSYKIPVEVKKTTVLSEVETSLYFFQPSESEIEYGVSNLLSSFYQCRYKTKVKFIKSLSELNAFVASGKARVADANVLVFIDPEAYYDKWGSEILAILNGYYSLFSFYSYSHGAISGKEPYFDIFKRYSLNGHPTLELVCEEIKSSTKRHPKNKAQLISIPNKSTGVGIEKIKGIGKQNHSVLGGHFARKYKNICVFIDDDGLQLEAFSLFKQCINQLGFEALFIKSEPNIVEPSELISSLIDDKNPERVLIFSDFQMAKKTGVVLAKELNKFNQLVSDYKFIMMSNAFSIRNINVSSESGVFAAIEKPSRFLEIQRYFSTSENIKMGNINYDLPLLEARLMDEFVDGFERHGKDPVAFTRSQMSSFLEKSSTLISEIKKSEKNFELILSSIHFLTGRSNLRFTRSYDFFCKLEKLFRKEGVKSIDEQYCKKINELYQETIHEVKLYFKEY